MKQLISLMALGLALAVSGAHAADDKAPTAQQSKMKTCNADAKDKKGDERKAFMKECLSAKPAATEDGKTPQQNKMKTCNADAKEKKGDERKKFMKECLSAK
ncbi:MAG: phosphate starvation-inducible protein PsiF [Betaproteobacteria bacterium]|nr:phosphate starvation-inducible protein PsiF [Betaproteobacteria bacterium]